MGLRALGINPVDATIRAVSEDYVRRIQAKELRALYQDNIASILRVELRNVINDRRRRELIEAFSQMASAINLFRRIVREVAGPVYAPPPRRIVEKAPDAMKAIEKETRLNAKMRQSAFICRAAGSVFLYDYYVPRIGLIRMPMWPDQVTVIPDPDDPTREGATIYDRTVDVGGGQKQLWRVYWDDEEAFQLGENNRMQPILTKDGYALRLTKDNGHPGILPITGIHLEERTDCYWTPHPSGDLKAGQKGISFALGLALRTLKVQGHTKWAINGDPARTPKGQVLDEEVPYFAGDQNTAQAVHSPTDLSQHFAAIEAITGGVGANHGVSRDRLNQKTGVQLPDMIGLLERRREMIEVFDEGEQRGFEKQSVVSRAHKNEKMRIPEGAELALDFAEISHKVDRETLLRIWREEMKLGLRRPEDNLIEDEPELGNDYAKAWKVIEGNVESWQKLVDLAREGDMSGENDLMEPGASAERNGRNGKAVAEGLMTKDEAAEDAARGKVPASLATARKRRGA